MTMREVQARQRIVIRSSNVMKGYYINARVAEAFKKQLVSFGRHQIIVKVIYQLLTTKIMILRGGYNIYPRGEEVMMTHEAVSLVGGYRGAVRQMGEEKLKAFVVKKTRSLERPKTKFWRGAGCSL
jgi:acyl-CoA synthetase (AMP-forming)/AMP-acid ligase II